MSDVEWQVKNWYNCVWTCGDSIVEQAIHSADKIAWALSDQPPVSCVGVGGRQIPAEGGNIFDHFEVNYLYPNGVRAFLGCRQIAGCHRENADYILGTTGQCTIGKGLRLFLGEPSPGDFRIREYHSRNRQLVKFDGLALDSFNGHTSLVAGFMGQHRFARHVADGQDVRIGGALVRLPALSLCGRQYR